MRAGRVIVGDGRRFQWGCFLFPNCYCKPHSPVFSWGGESSEAEPSRDQTHCHGGARYVRTTAPRITHESPVHSHRLPDPTSEPLTKSPGSYQSFQHRAGPQRRARRRPRGGEVVSASKTHQWTPKRAARLNTLGLCYAPQPYTLAVLTILPLATATYNRTIINIRYIL